MKKDSNTYRTLNGVGRPMTGRFEGTARGQARIIDSSFHNISCSEIGYFDDNRMLRRIFRPKREQVTGGWGKQDNEELHNLSLHLLGKYY
jgi:hypothetical protein